MFCTIRISGISQLWELNRLSTDLHGCGLDVLHHNWRSFPKPAVFHASTIFAKVCDCRISIVFSSACTGAT